MRIDIRVPAHLCQQVAADFFIPILEGGEFFAEVEATMAALPLSATNWQVTLLRRANFLTRRSNSAPPHRSILGQICPNIKWNKSSARSPACRNAVA
jgi:hypothetical protein